MTEKIILYAIIGIAVSTALAFLTKSTGKSVSIDESGQFNLRMNKLYGIMGVIGLVFGLLFLIFLPLTTESNDSGIWMAVILMLLIFWGTGIPCLMYYRNHRVTFDDNLIVATSAHIAYGGRTSASMVSASEPVLVSVDRKVLRKPPQAICPNNYFSLTWEAPDQSIDSLVGYNIYGGDSLYKFQNHIGAFCQEFDDTDCDFIYSFLNAGDYIKVTAVYNSPPEESIVADSAQFIDLIIGIDEKQVKDFNVYPNPSEGTFYIADENIEQVNVFTSSGKQILEQSNNQAIDLSDYSDGLYIFQVSNHNGTVIKTVMLKKK
jgi:hypothetical protein